MRKNPTMLSNKEARALVLAAHGFGENRADTPLDVVNNLQVLQIDSVNVFERSHYMPAFSRLGVYDRKDLDEELWGNKTYTEYWAHEAAFIPITDRHLFNWRMQDYRERFKHNGRAEKHRIELKRVKKLLREEGPSFAKDLEQKARERRGPWWDWSDTKRALEMLFATGEVVSLGRQNFVRRYALAEDSLPSETLLKTPRVKAQEQLIEKAAGALGVATAHDLADYFRLKIGEARQAIKSLERQGVLEFVTVEGWQNSRGEPEEAWVLRETLARLQETIADDLKPNALLTPFDPLCWFRPRTERIFNFHYRIEIYTPKEKRKYGYYCLPLMVDGELRGRIDLKADRAARTLVVQAAWQEEGAPGHTATVAKELIEEAARWQGLEGVTGPHAGNMSRLQF